MERTVEHVLLSWSLPPKSWWVPRMEYSTGVGVFQRRRGARVNLHGLRHVARQVGAVLGGRGRRGRRGAPGRVRVQPRGQRVERLERARLVGGPQVDGGARARVRQARREEAQLVDVARAQRRAQVRQRGAAAVGELAVVARAGRRGAVHVVQRHARAPGGDAPTGVGDALLGWTSRCMAMA
jgi:hypothetical protein